MSRAFAITASPDAVDLAPGATGTVAFTVTNHLLVAAQVRVRTAAEPPAEARWFTIRDDGERNILPGVTEQYTVKINVPAGTPPGSYRFRLDATSTANPDEDSTEGPSVVVKVPATEKPKKSFPWWILIVLLVVILAGGGLLWFLLSRGPGLNDPCEDDCKSGLVCTGEPKTCRGDLDFAGCNETAECKEGLACVEGVCSPPPLPGLGEACAGECAGGLFCVAGTCQEDTVGKECQADGGCGPGQKCATVGGQKLCLREAGQPCRAPVECLTLTCKEGHCATLQVGSACLFAAQCASSICSDGICKDPIRCPPLDARPCPANMICLSGTCRPRLRFTLPAAVFDATKARHGRGGN